MIIDSGVVTGSLQVSGSLNVKGNLTVDGNINGTITGSVTSASYATFAENAGLLNNLVSSSFVGTASFSTFSGSIVGRVVSLESASSSFATVSASYSTASGSLSTRTTNLESTASTLTTASSSFATVSASYATASGSLSTRVTTIETTYATTGSNTFTGNNVFGNITASNAQFNTASIQYLNIVYETASVIFSSGSNQFGDASNDVQTLWGRVELPSGPLVVTGSIQATNLTGSLNGSNLIAASVANDRLTNSTISGKALGTNLDALTISTGLGGSSYNGSTAVTITNTGVTSNVAGTAISVSGATGAVTITNTGVTSAVAGTAISLSGGTGAVTITNTGVTSAVAGTGVTVSGATGAVTVSIGQAVATSSNVQFNSLGVGTAGSATAGEIRATNDITAFYSSDERLKEDITPIENPIEKLMAIKGVTFSWKEGFDDIHSHKGTDTGVIAQDIEAIDLPDTVTTRENGYKAVRYEKLNALLIEGFKAHQKEINELKELVNTLLNK